mgnify:CR=1 FL=1
MRRILYKIKNKLILLYHRARYSDGIWRYLNRQARLLHAHYPPQLSGEGRAVTDSLRNTGIGITHISNFFPSEFFGELQSYAFRRWEDPDVVARFKKREEALEGDKLKSKAYFLVDLWEGKPILDLQNPFTRFSLSSHLFDVINAYLGMFSKFRAWFLQVTIPIPLGSRAFASQQWHRDPEDKRMVKVFLYLNDVDEGAGPFTYLKYSHDGGKWRHLFPQEPPRGSPPMPSNVDDFIPKEDRVVCTGKAGTIIFCDTSGLHKGGYVTRNNRIMYTSVYTSSASLDPIRYLFPTDFSKSSSVLDPKARFAVTYDPLKVAFRIRE